MRSTKMSELKFIHKSKILVTCLTGHADFDKLFRILQFRIFLSQFGELTSAEFSDTFTHKLIFLAIFKYTILQNEKLKSRKLLNYQNRPVPQERRNLGPAWIRTENICETPDKDRISKKLGGAGHR